MDHRYNCPGCGKPAPRHTVYHARGDVRIDPPDWWHKFPEDLIVRRRMMGNEVYAVDTWDGVSYCHRYDPFCTLRCALGVAKAAHRAGYRLRGVDEVAKSQPHTT